MISYPLERYTFPPFYYPSPSDIHKNKKEKGMLVQHLLYLLSKQVIGIVWYCHLILLTKPKLFNVWIHKRISFSPHWENSSSLLIPPTKGFLPFQNAELVEEIFTNCMTAWRHGIICVYASNLFIDHVIDTHYRILSVILLGRLK